MRSTARRPVVGGMNAGLDRFRALIEGTGRHVRVNGDGKFKAQCLALLESLDPEGILITKHGKPIARVIPASSDCAELIGSMKGKIKVHGDISSTGLKWNAQS